MNGKYRYGDKPATVTDAAGVSGVLIKGLDGDFTFRVYDKDGEFTDYDLNHDDLSVTIAADEMASFYSFGESRVLDHSPCVGVGESGGVTPSRVAAIAQRKSTDWIKNRRRYIWNSCFSMHEGQNMHRRRRNLCTSPKCKRGTLQRGYYTFEY